MNAMSSIPPFTAKGVLPQGGYAVTFEELRNSILVNGVRQNDWDRDWRLHLVNQAEVLVRQLWKIGINDVFLDGSFVEDKAHPNDIDGYFICDLNHLATGKLQRELNALDPHKVWTWDPASRRSYKGFTKKQLPMWLRYRVELYPHVGQPSGIVDEHGNQQLFPAAFRKQRQTFEPKGIVQVVKEGV